MPKLKIDPTVVVIAVVVLLVVGAVAAHLLTGFRPH